jgi:hypothetical protein
MTSYEELAMWSTAPLFPSNNMSNERKLYKINPFTHYITKEGIYQANMANRHKSYTRLSEFKGMPRNIIEGTPFGIVPEAMWSVRPHRESGKYNVGLLQTKADEIPRDIQRNSKQIWKEGYALSSMNGYLDTHPYKFSPQRV